ncbi:MAG: 5-methyltetrahydropteroyltriglutamate--homocysteine S-methyltransferase, partial [Anaerolineales bacterium]
YPRIGKKREIKRALESYWRGKLDADNLMDRYWQVAEENWLIQKDAGIDYIGVGSATLYDQMLDWAFRFGLIPSRFTDLQGLDQYFAMARGVPGKQALAMTKWFNTNYHYLVPEIDAATEPSGNCDDFIKLVKKAQTILGDRAVPIIIGPLTLLNLSRLTADFQEVFQKLLPHYVTLLTALATLGVKEVQIHEPALVVPDAGQYQAQVMQAYELLAACGTRINLVTYFSDLCDAYEWVVKLPVSVLSLDFTRGNNLEIMSSRGWPKDKTLGAGVTDARSVWRMRDTDIVPLMDKLVEITSGAIRAGVSASLQFVPYTVQTEKHIPGEIRGVLAFAEEKLHELVQLAGNNMAEGRAAWDTFRAFLPANGQVQSRIAGLRPEDFNRSQPYPERLPLQVKLPALPTTTIGSFPQTGNVRRCRAQYQNGEISKESYEAEMDTFIAYAVGVQDGLGLDMVVHGEFERTDMVEYFAQKMEGFAFTENGWVQSFGSRCVRPPIIIGDISRTASMTVREFVVAQSLTTKPVKGMLTGPVTIINWSYPRTDISQREIAYQIALALRDEIHELEEAGARAVQVDEPALREGLPLSPDTRGAYLSWAVDAFKLTTANALPETQIHTHMCYSEFGQIMEAINALDADVISIENARSDDATLRGLAAYGYPRAVGPGVYDIHSPVIPEVAFIKDKLQAFLQHLDPHRLWVNPDCGLKTRSWEEVIPALQNMMKAVFAVRGDLEIDG